VALTIDWENQLINVTSPQTDVLVQDLIDFIRTEEPCCEGIAYSKVANATGKDSLGGAASTGITLTLLDNWQLKFWTGSYTATISGGNLIGGPGGDPVAYTAGVQVVIIQSAASTLVVTGSGVAPSDIDDIADAVWDELSAGHLIGGSFGELLAAILTDTGTSIPSLISAIDGKIDTIDAVVDVIEKLTGNRVTRSGDIITVYNDDGVSIFRRYDVSNLGRVQI
jgi:hypothetical protein